MDSLVFYLAKIGKEEGGTNNEEQRRICRGMWWMEKNINFVADTDTGL